MTGNRAIEFLNPDGTTPDRLSDLPAEKQERLRAIRDLKRRGLTNAAIAKILGCGEATIYRDMKMLRELFIARAGSIATGEEVGAALDLYEEIIDKAMEGHRAAVEDNEQVVSERTENGEQKTAVKSVPNHEQANRYLATALSAQKYKMDMLVQMGMAQMLNKALEQRASQNGKLDISKIRTPEELESSIREQEEKIIATERKMHEIEGPSPFDYEDRSDYEKARDEHMRRFEEYLEVKQRLHTG